MPQVDLNANRPLESNKPGRNLAKTKGPTNHELRGLATELLGSAGRIAAYAGITAVIGLIAVAIALFASGTLAI